MEGIEEEERTKGRKERRAFFERAC